MALPGLVLLALPLSVGAGCLAEGPPSPRPSRSSAEDREAGSPALVEPFEDGFDREHLGPDWLALSPAWRLDEGRLCARGARNRGVWLQRRLPTNVRVEVTAVAGSEDGDLKLEIFGDGQSGASGDSYDDATSYLAILGGWRNQRHVLARLSEHGADRQEVAIDPGAEDPRAQPVEPGRPYRLRLERRDGRTLRFEVDDRLLLEVEDPAPLAGSGHDHLALNDWDAPVCFDDLRVTPLPPR